MLKLIAAIWLTMLAYLASETGLAQTTSLETETRTWSDASGKFKFEARLQEVDGDTVVLESADKKIKRIPLSRLSAKDQSYVASLQNESPFEVEDPALSKPRNRGLSADPIRSTFPALSPIKWREVVDPAWSSAVQPDFKSPKDWKLSVDVPNANQSIKYFQDHMPIADDGRLASLITNNRSQNFCRAHEVILSPKDKEVRTFVFGPTGPINVFSKSKKLILPRVLLDDGLRMIMIGAASNGLITRSSTLAPVSHTIELGTVDGKELQRSGPWRPYATKQADHDTDEDEIVKLVGLSGDLFLTINKKSHIAVWNIKNQQLVWHSTFVSKKADACVSPDGKHVAIIANHRLAIVASETGQVEALLELSAFRGFDEYAVGWSPNGQRIAIARRAMRSTNIYSIDAASGEIIGIADMRYGTMFIVSMLGGQKPTLEYLDDRYLLLDGKHLYDLEKHTSGFEVTGVTGFVRYASKSMVYGTVNKQDVVAPLSIQDPMESNPKVGSNSTAGNANGEPPNELLLQPGDSVSIDVRHLSEKHRSAIRAKVEQLASKSGYRVNDSAEAVFVARLAGPKSITLDVLGGKSFSMFETELALYKRGTFGDPLWSASFTNVPQFTATDTPQSILRKIEQHNSEPSFELLEKVQIPKEMLPWKKVKLNAQGELHAFEK